MSECPVGSDTGRRALASAAPLTDPQGAAAASGVRGEVPRPRVTVEDRVVVHWLVVACMTGLQVVLGLMAVASVVYLLRSAIQDGPDGPPSPGPVRPAVAQASADAQGTRNTA